MEAHLLVALAEEIEGRNTALGLAARLLQLLDSAVDVASLHIQHTQIVTVHQVVGIAFHEALGFEELELVQLGLDRGNFVLKRRGIGRVGLQLFLLGVNP